IDDVARPGAILQMGHAVSESALSNVLGDNLDSPAERVDDAAARAAVAELSMLVRETPGRGDESRELLLAALVAGDGPAAADAVHSYYLIDVGGASMQTAIPGVVAELERVLPSWRGS